MSWMVTTWGFRVGIGVSAIVCTTSTSPAKVSARGQRKARQMGCSARSGR
jgi:hypothetical protein